MVILSKACKPDNFESHDSLKLSFTNIRGLHSNFVDCEFFLESISLDIRALCETNLDDSTDSGNFFVRGYLPLIQKDSSTYMHGLTVNVKEGLPFTQDLSLKNSAKSSFSSIDYLLHLCAWFLILFHRPKMWFSRSIHLQMSLSLETLTSIIRTGLSMLVQFIDLVISNDLTQMVNFPTQTPNCDSHSTALLDLFLSSNASICSTMASLHWEILIMLLS